MPTVSVKISVPDAYQEFLIAELSDLDFEAFEMEDESLTAYIASARWDDVRRETIENWLRAHGLAPQLQEIVLADENWNKKWEETVGPVVVDPFLIKPTWHAAPTNLGEMILLEIDPKMSFGTGYHETTRLLLRMIPDHVQAGMRVLDAGTGTGILAIAAAKVGAESVDAFDIDPWSQQNAEENTYLNQVQDLVTIIAGPIDEVASEKYDLILANINLNVIIGLLGEFGIRLKKGGQLLASGILRGDRGRLVEAAERHRFDLVQERTEGEWWAGALLYRGF